MGPSLPRGRSYRGQYSLTLGPALESAVEQSMRPEEGCHRVRPEELTIPHPSFEKWCRQGERLFNDTYYATSPPTLTSDAPPVLGKVTTTISPDHKAPGQAQEVRGPTMPRQGTVETSFLLHWRPPRHQGTI